MSRLPIRVRVTAAFALAMAAVLAGTGWFLYARLESHLSAALNGQLQQRAQDLAALVSQPQASLRSAGGGRFIEPGESYAELLDQSGRVLDATRPLGAASLLDTAQLRVARRRPVFVERGDVPGLNEPSRILATPIRRAGRRLVLVVGATTQNNAETLDHFRRELLLAGPAALLLASLVGYLVVGLSLRPVESMRRRAATVSAEAPGERLPVPPTGDELERLGETLNAMLERLETALERERGFVADAGHELRTPLALLRTELELALRQAGSEQELREAVARSSQEADRLSQLAEDLLLIARSDRGKLPLRVEELGVDELFASVSSRFAWRTGGREIEFDPRPELRVSGDRIRLEQALGNLVDNALRYGDGDVHLSARLDDGAVELHVADRGGGFPPEFVERAFDRFTRADTARFGGGAGLGLSIVRAIALAHGGEAHAANRGGGADVWLVLPRS
jgi:heavy metal sensor kinase